MSPNHGYLGQTFTVTGQGVSPFPGVRVAWLIGGATQTAALADLAPDNRFSITLTMPPDAQPGPVQVCAAVIGSPLAEFACQTFTIDTPPSATVRGQIPLAATVGNSPHVLNTQAVAASVILENRIDGQVATGPIQADGFFVVSDVSPGPYVAYVAGSTPSPLDSLSLDIEPDSDVTVKFVEVKPSICEYEPPSMGVAAISATPNSLQGWDWAGALGVYVRGGPSLPVAFKAELNGDKEDVDRVEFLYRYDGHSLLLGSDASEPYQISYDVATLPAGQQTSLYVRPVPKTGCAEEGSRRLVLIENPMAAPYIQGGSLTWDSANGRYEFRGTIPIIPGQLPVNHDVMAHLSAIMNGKSGINPMTRLYSARFNSVMTPSLAASRFLTPAPARAHRAHPAGGIVYMRKHQEKFERYPQK